MKKLALVLGGGSAKGYAHIGVLKVLEKHGIKPDLIVGTSMGALVGGMYAAGKSVNEMEEMTKSVTSLGGFSLISTLFKGNLLSADKITKVITKELGEAAHSDCKIPFVAIATELKTGKEKRFDKGLLRDSILSSTAIPGVFPKHKVGDKYYVDGGMVNNLGEDVARELMPDAVVLSVDVIGQYEKQLEALKLKTLEHILNVSTMRTQMITEMKPNLADLRIIITQPTVSLLDFSAETVQRAIRNGKNATTRNITKIKELLGMETNLKK